MRRHVTFFKMTDGISGKLWELSTLLEIIYKFKLLINIFKLLETKKGYSLIDFELACYLKYFLKLIHIRTKNDK